MKLVINIRKNIKSLSLMGILLIVFIFQINSKMVGAVSMNNYKSEFVIEELRLKVPFQFKEDWLELENNIWEPWLSQKDGFMGRQIFWNKEKEEALILVNWRNRKLWKSIKMEEVNEIQEEFEKKVKLKLDLSDNPFKLIYEGELYNQK